MNSTAKRSLIKLAIIFIVISYLSLHSPSSSSLTTLTVIFITYLSYLTTITIIFIIIRHLSLHSPLFYHDYRHRDLSSFTTLTVISHCTHHYLQFYLSSPIKLTIIFITISHLLLHSPLSSS